MFTYGSQVNPALLRQDFSPIAQGAQALAQGTAQAAQIRAQGMANMGARIGEGISEGFKSYIQNREKNSILEGKNAGMLRAMEKDPVLNADPDFINLREKQQRQGGLNLADNSKLNALLVTYDEQNRLRQEGEMKKLYADQAKAATERQRFELDEEKRRNAAFIAFSRNRSALGENATPEQLLNAAIAAGMQPRDYKDVLGVDLTIEQINQSRINFQNQLFDRTTALEEKARDAEFVKRVMSGDEKGYRIEKDPNTGASIVVQVGPGGIKLSSVIPAPDNRVDRGTKAEQYRKDYLAAVATGDLAAQRIAATNWAAETGTTGGLDIAEQMLRRSVNQGKGELEVTGGLKPVQLPAFDQQMPDIGRLNLGVPPQSGPTLVDIVRGTGTARADANEAGANFLRGAANRIGELMDSKNWRGASSKGGGAMVFENKTKLDNLKSQLRALSNKDSFAAESLRKQIAALENKPSPLK